MKLKTLRKKDGSTRTVVIQGPKDKHTARALAWRLTQILAAHPACHVIHGFFPGRNPVTNAQAHAQAGRYTLCMDLRDFFGHCTESRIFAGGADRQTARAATLATPENPQLHAAQGLSSSPAAANVAALPMDAAILQHLSTLPHPVTYTRYADDLSFSSEDLPTLRTVRDALPKLAADHGQEIHPGKTRIMDGRHRHRIITGVSISPAGEIRPTRAVRRRLRAARHQAAHGKPWARKSARGLQEWAACKTPRIDSDKITRCEGAHLQRAVFAAFA